MSSTWNKLNPIKVTSEKINKWSHPALKSDPNKTSITSLLVIQTKNGHGSLHFKDLWIINMSAQLLTTM